MRARKGYSFLELLIVAVIVSIVIVRISVELLTTIDDARAMTLTSPARSVHLAAQQVIAEQALGAVPDRDYEEGLTGTAGDDASRPVAARLSQRMNALLAPDVVLAESPAPGKACVTFTVQDGKIQGMTYETYLGRNRYKLTLTEGEEAVVERVK